MDWISLPGLSFVIVTNSAPVVVARLAGARGAWPIDGGLVLRDGQRLLGAHKTWRGLVAGVAAGAILAPWIDVPWWLGGLAGATTIVGDALSSFAKRRLRLQSGSFCPGIDQLPEAVLPLLVLWRPLGLGPLAATATVAVFVALGSVASRLVGSSRRHRPAGPE